MGPVPRAPSCVTFCCHVFLHMEWMASRLDQVLCPLAVLYDLSSHVDSGTSSHAVVSSFCHQFSL